MQEFPWEFNNSTYTLETVHGKAIIHEYTYNNSQTVGNKYKYVPSFISLPENSTVEGPQFNDFEMAETWLIDGYLMNLESPQKLLETLDYCNHLLQTDAKAETHQKRIQLIKNILQVEDSATFAEKQWAHSQTHPQDVSISLDWHWDEEENKSFADTGYGQAAIIEKRERKVGRFGLNKISHIAEIKHASGAKMSSSPLLEFEDAELWINKNLTGLENPTRSKGDFVYLIFTLKICENLLPSDADVMHIIRLGKIESEVGFVLL